MILSCHIFAVFVGGLATCFSELERGQMLDDAVGTGVVRRVCS